MIRRTSVAQGIVSTMLQVLLGYVLGPVLKDSGGMSVIKNAILTVMEDVCRMRLSLLEGSAQNVNRNNGESLIAKQDCLTAIPLVPSVVNGKSVIK
jgi:hypothetical protein